MEKALFESGKTDWETPDWLFERLNREFSFTCDVCATVENTKVVNFISPDVDALMMDWSGMCWMNPPYGREISVWMHHARQHAMSGYCTVVCLVPARTDTQWWWNTARHGEVRFLKGRLKFKGAENSAPFPSAIVVFRKSMKFGEGTTMYWEIKDDSSDG